MDEEYIEYKKQEAEEQERIEYEMFKDKIKGEYSQRVQGLPPSHFSELITPSQFKVQRTVC